MTGSSLPGQLDLFHIDQANPADMAAGTTHLAWTQKASDAIEKIEAAIGLPAFSNSATVDDRLAALDAALTAFGAPYQLRSEKGAAGGYASLSGSGRVPVAQIGSGTPNGTKFLRDDGVFAVPAGGGGGSAAAPFDFTLASPIAYGDTTVSFNETLPPEIHQQAAAFVVDPGTSVAEGFRIKAGTNQITGRFANAHAADAKVVWLRDGKAHTGDFGAYNDLAHSDWGALMRAMMSGLPVDGGGKTHMIDQMLPLVNGLTLENATIVAGDSSVPWLAPITAYANAPDAEACVRSVATSAEVSANASTNRFQLLNGVTLSDMGLVAGSRVCISSFYGETLPGGVTGGKRLYINNVYPGTQEFDLTTIRNSGVVLDITSNGSSPRCGYVFASWPTLAHGFLRHVRFEARGGVKDMNLVHIKWQQQSYMDNAYITAPSSTNDYGACGLMIGNDASPTYGDGTPSGQLANFNDLTFVGPDFQKGYCLDVAGVGYVFTGKVSFNSKQPCARISGQEHDFGEGFHLEQWWGDGIQLNGGKLIHLGQIHASNLAGAGPAIHDTANTQYTYDTLQYVNQTGDPAIVRDGAYTLRYPTAAQGGMPTGVRDGDFDPSDCITNFSQTGWPEGPKFRRSQIWVSGKYQATINLRWWVRTLYVDCGDAGTNANVVVNLPDATAMGDLPFTIYRADSAAPAAKTVTVKDSSGATLAVLDGQATSNPRGVKLLSTLLATWIKEGTIV